MKFLRRIAIWTYPLLLWGAASAALGQSAVRYRNPVRAGDYPDPSVIRVGSDYWAMATSSEWAPHFPILHSRDLVNWEITGSVFDQRPAWASANFWAPEISEDRGKFFAYYVAREAASGRLAVAVATADQPAGPYTDHGPLIAQAAGSIDPMPFTDAEGSRWLVWKEDGNSQKRPTPIWLQRLTADGLALSGAKHELIRNDAPWEGAVTEGPFLLYRAGYYYLFYSGGACCGRACDYALGVARAKQLLGPWEKSPGNPIMAGNADWRCPGHGSIAADPEGRYWLLHHAYARAGFVATGRELLLDEVVFGADGWPTINGGKGPSVEAIGPAALTEQLRHAAVRDDFDGAGGSESEWEWLLGRKPDFHLGQGHLLLEAQPGGAALVRGIVASSFVAETAVELPGLTEGASAGLVVFGDRANQLALRTDGKVIQISSECQGRPATIAQVPAPQRKLIRLRIACAGGNQFRFAAQAENGTWFELGQATDGRFLPPWDRGLRAGLAVEGRPGAAASFAYFAATPAAGTLLAP